jgi:outer membrane protein OmpA-like peptidoglycan-associated protein
VRFAGYRVESGRLSAELRYRVREGRLVGQNALTFEELQLGEKVQGAGVRDLPLELAVALLADAQGRINLDIPVSGNLNDPQFDFGGLVARALGNVIGKIVSAPFRVLASAFGKDGDDLDRVSFEPGSAALSPPAEQSVAQVAKVLRERPRLSLTVQGGYDPQADLRALRRDAVRREIARRAGREGEGPLDFGDPKVLQAAERLYLERVGNRLQMLALRDSEPRYARALVEQLAAETPVQPDTAQTLARARAENVRAELLAQGVDPSRVRLEAPATREAGKEGVPTVLALDTEGGAAAGATAR